MLASRGCPFEALSPEDQDWTLADHILDLFEISRTSEGLAGAATLLAACCKANPHRQFRAAWKTLDAWRSQCPPKQAPALPAQFAFALVSWLLVGERDHIALAILLCFCGLLRASEALNLRYQHVVRSGSTYVLILGETKRGQEQKVVLVDPGVCQWIDLYLASHPAPKSRRLIGCTYNTLQRWLRKGLDDLGCGDVPWTTHSLRRGGASELARRNAPLLGIMHYGRWLSSRSAREYIRRGEVALLEASDTFPPEAWEASLSLARLGATAWFLRHESNSGWVSKE